MKLTRTLRYVILGLIVLIAGALGGWYYFLRSGENSTNAESAARGYNAPAPVFSAPAGSTYQNILSALGLSSASSTASSGGRLWEVSPVPVAGFGWSASSTADASSSIAEIYFVERSSGYIYESDTQSRQILRLTDTLRPKTYGALVAEDGSVIERSIDDNGTPIVFAGSIASSSDPTATSSSEDLAGEVLPEGIEDVALNPVSKTIYYTVANASGVTLVSSNWAETKETNLLSMPLYDWRLFALQDGSVFLLQSPLDGVEGYAYQVGSGGSLSLVAQAPGLTIAPRASSTALLWGSSAGGTLSLYAQASVQATPVQLPIQTVADKCAWAPGTSLIAYCGVPGSIPSQQFLDDWYKGIVHTADQVYEVDASLASTTLIFSPGNQNLDIEDPQVDPTGQYLGFINAADGTLWVLQIAQ